MTKPAPRSELVAAVRDAERILDEALPLPGAGDAADAHRRRLRVAAFPVLLRELLDVDVTGSPSETMVLLGR